MSSPSSFRERGVPVKSCPVAAGVSPAFGLHERGSKIDHDFSRLARSRCRCRRDPSRLCRHLCQRRYSHRQPQHPGAVRDQHIADVATFITAASVSRAGHKILPHDAIVKGLPIRERPRDPGLTDSGVAVRGDDLLLGLTRPHLDQERFTTR